MIHPLLINSRILFKIQDCPYCKKWEAFIEKVNSELKFDKRVEVIDCTKYYKFGIIENPKLRLFLPYINGEFPVLFFEGGMRKDGTNSVIEAEAWLRALLHEDFINKEYNPYMWDRECEYGKRGIFKRKIVCN